jgi:hypothetical protein
MNGELKDVQKKHAAVVEKVKKHKNDKNIGVYEKERGRVK